MNDDSVTTADVAAPPKLAGAAAIEWALDPSLHFMNHGCFGARPLAVIEAQQQRRLAFERSPVHVLDRLRDDQIAEARSKVAAFLGAPADDLVFVTNTTEGVNAVLRSIDFKAGDEILTANHVYNAVRQTMKYLARKHGAQAIEIEIPFPTHGPEQIVEAFRHAINERTRVVIIDHITSPTAVRFPVEELITLCRDRGVLSLIDGAHAPGMIDVNITELAPDYYIGNLHKWVCAPVGAAFLYARPELQRDLHPVTISHFLDEGMVHEFNWQGTRDITPWLTAADAIEILGNVGWAAIRQHNHAMVVWVQRLLCDRWSVEPTSPTDGSMLGSMVTSALPEGVTDGFSEPAELQAVLMDQHRIEVPIVDWNDRWWVRPSCQIYNSQEQYELLADAVLQLR